MNELKFLELHGDRVAYRDEGDGEVLLLIHGMAGSSEHLAVGDTAAVEEVSRDRARPARPRRVGETPGADYSLGAFAVWLRDLLDELGVSHATLVGQSLGGGVAMQFVYQHPDYAKRLVLISSGGLGPDVGLVLRLALGARGRAGVADHRAEAGARRREQAQVVVEQRGDSIAARRRVVERLLVAVGPATRQSRAMSVTLRSVA